MNITSYMRSRIAIWSFLVIIAVLLTPCMAYGEDPVIVAEGVCDEVPFRAMCMTIDDAATVAADLLKYKGQVGLYKKQLDQCMKTAEDAHEEALGLCQDELTSCYEIKTAPPIVKTEEVMPWWSYVVIGGSFVVGLAGGVFIGLLL